MSMAKQHELDSKIRNDLVKRIKKLSTPLEPQPPDVAHDLRKLEGIEAVVLDVYGTMFISGTGDISLADEGDSSEAIIEALTAVRFDIKPHETTAVLADLYDEAIKSFMNERKSEGIDFPEVNIVAIWEDVLSGLMEKGLLEGDLNDTTIRQFSVEYECRSNPIWPMPDLEETLNAIHDEQYALGIVSNSQFYTPLMFDAMLASSVDELGFSKNLSVWSYQELIGKPSLMLYEVLRDRVNSKENFELENILYVGNDMLKDIYPADKLGFRTALFAGDERSYKTRSDDARCKNVKPDVTITELKQLLACI